MSKRRERIIATLQERGEYPPDGQFDCQVAADWIIKLQDALYLTAPYVKARGHLKDFDWSDSDYGLTGGDDE